MGKIISMGQGTRPLSLTIFLVFSFLFLISFNLYSQEKFTCGSDIIHQDLLNTNPEYKANFEALSKEIYQNALKHLKDHSADNLPPYVIPVVVHIITPPGTPIGNGNNITNTQVEEGLELLNDAFANSGSFQTSNGVDVGINFCLAKRDPNGQPTNGITRTESSLVADVTPCTPFGTNMNNGNSIKALINWNCKEYLNVWLVTDLYNGMFGCSLAGFATFPGAGCGFDGVVQESKYWITKSGTGVTAHEVGHYFSLHHTFNGGCINNNCLLDGDQVCDTPPDGSASFAACNTNSCNTDMPDLMDDNTNYMDYTSCQPPHFTAGQRTRMITGLEKGRTSLTTSLGCIPVINLDAAIVDLHVISGGCGNTICPEVVIKNTGSTTLTSGTLLIKIDGITVSSFPWTGTLTFNSSLTINLPCVNNSIGIHDIEVELINPNGGTDGFLANNSITLNDFILNEKPEISLVSYEESRCGSNGVIKVKTDKGIAPYLYTINGLPINKQLSPEFYDLSNQVYTVIVEDAIGCVDTLIFNLPDICPPCISGVINKYAAILGFCDTATLAVDDASGFKPGDKVMIYQAKGATIDSTNTANFGNILNIGNAGNYEYNRISKIDGNTITLQFIPKRKYDIPGKPQIITIPNLGNATVCNLTCAPWDGLKGGVLVFDADTLTMVGNIDVSSKGFRGGQVEHAPSYNPPFHGYFSNSNINGGTKGEGIDVLTGNQFKFAKGNRANGGGGGNDHNAGGGGGANYGNGGLGGMGLQPTFDPLLQGIGGKALNYTILPDNIFLGGGGGAGHSNVNFCGAGTSGGNGGGIAILNIAVCKANNNKILASGEDALSPGSNNGCDGAGGGGAGGLIIYNSLENASNISLIANGGNGGDVYEQQNYLGPGGGGGGGHILTTLPLPPIITIFQVFGGQNGLRNQMDDYGATPGENGNIRGSAIIPQATIAYEPIGNVVIDIDTFCFGNGFVKVTASTGTELPEFKLDDGAWLKYGAYEVLSEGSHFLSIRTKCNQLDTIFTINWPEALKDTLIHLESVTCNFPGKIHVDGLNGIPPYQFKLNNGTPQLTGLFENLIPGDYTISIIDAKGCEIQKELTLEDLSKQLTLVTDSMDIAINCGDTTAFMAVHAEGTYPFYNYTLNGGPKQAYGIFSNLKPGSYTINAYDDFGCVSNTMNFIVTAGGPDTTITQDIILCQGESIIVGTNTYNIGGNYIDTLTNFEGCDSIVITNLTTNPLSNTFQNIEICSGDSLIVGTNVYKSSGFYVDVLNNIFGCDSTINTNLTIVPFKSFTQTLNICNGEQVTVGNKTYSTSGNYLDTLTSIAGCDSIINTNLTVLPSVNYNQQVVLCAGESIIIGNNTYSTSGTFIDTLTSFNGCDSILTTNIQVLQSSSSNHSFTICTGTSINFNNVVYTTAGIFKDTILNFNGCDSIITVQIIVTDAITESIGLSICPGDTVSVNGKQYNATGFYTDTLVSQKGCDSILLIQIIDQNTSLCDSADCMMFLPNVFTPNGDGINDNFEVFVKTVLITEMEIYDRWGELVIKINDTSPKWNGKTSTGKPMHEGVYIYLVRGTCSDGSPVFKFGDVTLVR